MIEPRKYNLVLRYECPVCQTEHWVTEEEASVPGGRFLCCDLVHHIKPISNVKIAINFMKAKSSSSAYVVNKKDAEIAVEPKLLTFCVAMLRKQGYLKSESETMIKDAIEANPKLTKPSEIVKEALSRVSV